MSSYLQVYTTTDLESLLRTRPGETKLGERIQLAEGADWYASVKDATAKYVLLGIPEDIGVRANLGLGGAHTAWDPALAAFLNIHSTEQLSGAEVLLLGAFRFTEWMEASETMDTAGLRELTARIDAEVSPVIRSIVAAGKIPLVVGGGHNNCYPLISGAAEGLDSVIHCINLDAHSDFRVMEGRHSGNGFRYAHQEGTLGYYAMLGLHENYNSTGVLRDLDDNEALHYSTFENIFIREEHSFAYALGEAIQHTAAAPLGIEVDLDCIAHTLSSAATPSGISPEMARRYLYTCGALPDIAYLHIAEGATQLRDGRSDASVAKLIAYLLSDFIKAGLQQD
jgi:formiminoglutamase